MDRTGNIYILTGAWVYDIVINELIKRGRAYPCFCHTPELNEIRTIQEKQKERTGYYGKYAKCRDLSPEEAIKRIENNEITYDDAILKLQKPHSMKQLYIGVQELCDMLKISDLFEFNEKEVN